MIDLRSASQCTTCVGLRRYSVGVMRIAGIRSTPASTFESFCFPVTSTLLTWLTAAVNSRVLPSGQYIALGGMSQEDEEAGLKLACRSRMRKLAFRAVPKCISTAGARTQRRARWPTCHLQGRGGGGRRHETARILREAACLPRHPAELPLPGVQKYD